MGIVYFDKEGNATVLHNGSAGKGQVPKVNVYKRDSRDFDTWFVGETKYRVLYKKIDMEE